MLFSDSQRTFVEAMVWIAYTNPFNAATVRQFEEIAGQADIGLGVEAESIKGNTIPDRPQLPLLLEKSRLLLEHLQPDLKASLSADELQLYEDLSLLVLYFRFRERFQETLTQSLHSPGEDRVAVDYFQNYQEAFRQLLLPVGSQLEPTHLFACHFQIRRAYDLIYAHVFGNSPLIQKLRADIWHSVFTHDMRRYRISLFDRMHEISTLITGESGTGKELVARAVGLSRYVPFDAKKKQFKESLNGAFHPVNMAALSSQLIESELFGHSKGSFTGAIKDREGWFEVCRRSHCVFLDEIGELEPTLQVKLLRVLQTRTFERIGETNARKFEGKVISATNRNLGKEIHAGRFRADVYYRLCSDQIHAPSLREQIQDKPDELEKLVHFLAQRVCPEEPENVARDVIEWIVKHLPKNYPWPGNFRELEQCVRNVLVRREYHPLPPQEEPAGKTLASVLSSLRLSAADLTRVYATLIYQQTESYVATGRILGVDRRTIKEWLLTEKELKALGG